MDIFLSGSNMNTNKYVNLNSQLLLEVNLILKLGLSGSNITMDEPINQF